MSAPKEKSLENSIKRLGVIAGGGDLPARLLSACDKRGTEVFVVALEGQASPALVEGREHMLSSLGEAGQIISTLKSHDITDLVLIGSIRRPSLLELKPDIRTAQFFAGIVLKALGDDGVLKAIKDTLQGEGFTIHGVQDFAQDLIAKEGAVGRYKPKKADEPDIVRGIEAAKKIGSLDIGQAVIVQEGMVLGVEGVEGTDELIKRCSAYKRKGRPSILVKMAKPGQDRDLDLPTVGPETVALCASSGIGGIVIEAGNSLLIDPHHVASIADKHKIFVIGRLCE